MELKKMGKVMTVLKVFPKEEYDVAKLSDNVSKIKGCVKSSVEDYVFGQKIVKASFVCEDSEGVDFEELAKAVEGASEVQVDEVGLIS
ncbi:hypothetical protein HY993_02245 [Candidatus Micrarchaeota archaeon]|nr:hypothetical protein [Candidatus Micrarchaeota archaeon]